MLVYGGANGSALGDLWSLEGFPVVTAVEETAALPDVPAMEQNYPNPFNSGTVIDYRVARGQDVQLRVYNLAGQRVATLFEGFRPPGAHRAAWDGRDDRGRAAASGAYLYRLESDGRALTKKLLLLR